MVDRNGYRNVASALHHQQFKFTRMFYEEDFWFAGKQGLDPYMPDKSSKTRKMLMANRAKRIRKQIAIWDARLDAADPAFKQAKSLIAKFGGIVPFCVAVGVAPSKLLTYYIGITSKGTLLQRGGQWRRGLLPHRVVARAIVVARYWGVYLTPMDIWPDFVADPKYVANLVANKEMIEWIRNRQQQRISYTQFEDMLALNMSMQD